MLIRALSEDLRRTRPWLLLSSSNTVTVAPATCSSALRLTEGSTWLAAPMVWGAIRLCPFFLFPRRSPENSCLSCLSGNRFFVHGCSSSARPVTSPTVNRGRMRFWLCHPNSQGSGGRRRARSGIFGIAWRGPGSVSHGESRVGRQAFQAAKGRRMRAFATRRARLQGDRVLALYRQANRRACCGAFVARFTNPFWSELRLRFVYRRGLRPGAARAGVAQG